MCHERWWSFHRPWLEHPSKIAPQPMREASVVSILRWHEAPNMGPWDRNQSSFHITKARKHRRVTLIMWKGVAPRGNPLVLSHHWMCLMYNSPKSITLDAAAIRPNSLWTCLTVSDWPSLILFTADRMDSIRAGDRCACIDVESHATPGKVVICRGETHSFWRLAITPTLSCGQEWHLDAELPPDATELESTNCQCSSLCEYPEDKEVPGPHLRISWKCGVIMLGRTEEPDIGMLCPQERTSGTCCDTEGWICGSMRPWDLSWQTNPRIWSVAWFLKVSILNLSWMTESFRTRRSKMECNPSSFFGTMKYRL